MWTSSGLQGVGCWFSSLRRMGDRDRDTPMLWQRGVREGVMEHLERALTLAYRKLERLTGLRVSDRHRHLAVGLTPQQPDLDPVARAPVEFACDVGAWPGHLAFLPRRVIAMTYDERARAHGTAVVRRPA